MRSFFFLQWLIFFSSTKLLFCWAANEGAQTFTFFKHGVKLPGPSMSFNASLKIGIFEFEFKTFVERALMLYQDDNGDWDYIRLKISGGRLGLSFRIEEDKIWNLNSEDGVLYNDFHWHKVRIARNLTHFIFGVDGKTKARATTSPTFLSNLLLGGFPEKRYDERSLITSKEALWLYVTPMDWRGFFLGCIRNIKYGPDETSLLPINDIPSLRFHVTKGSCDLNLCQKRRRNKRPGICENNGVCKPSDTSLAVCDCRGTGYDGSTCTKEALRLILSGTYEVAYKWRTKASLVVKKEHFMLRIKTAKESAIILVAKAARGSSDKLTLEIKDSRFMVTSSTADDEGEDILHSREVVSDNIWHLVKYTRNGNMLTLDVDGNTVNLTSSKSDTTMNYDNILYIGKRSNSSNLTIEIEDFIWEYPDKEINFIKGLFESFGSSTDEFTVIPKGIVPMFNRKLTTRNEGKNSSISRVSTNIDNCTKANKECHLNAYCDTTENSHVCICKTGYTGDGMYNCTDIDECNGSSVPCDKNAECTNRRGSFKCTCKLGFSGDGHFNCTDVNECAETPALCLGKCTNTLGSYTCSCSTGFTGDGKHNCQDVDECGKDSSVCNPIATCTNTEGSFICKCPDEYRGDGVYTCLPKPVNPCDSLPCFPGLKCSTTTNGSYICDKCPPSFVGDGVNCERNQTSKDIVSKKIELVLANEKWQSELTDRFSQIYKALATKLIENIREIYEGHPEFVYVVITKFRKGSVVAEIELLFTKDVKDPFKPVKEAINDGKLANIIMDTKQPVASTDSKDNILGLDQTVFICVIALVAGVCILGVAMMIFLVILRRSRSRNVPINNGEEKENLNTKEAEVIQSCLGDCEASTSKRSIMSDRVACLFPVDGKCPHGMLRVDSDEQGKKSCDVRHSTVDDPDPRFCCLLSNTVDLKVKESPCTGGSSRSNIDL